ncbi:MAG: alpha/beta hydrolase [Nitrososphaerales archaeon]|jgi:pimeloyl-ACP methyl ester carboxylesterase
MSREVEEAGRKKEEGRDGAVSTTYELPYAGSSRVELVVEERGEDGRPSFLLLHGGAGPASMARFASLLAERHGARVITPTHPGFARTKRPDELRSVEGLAQVYAALLDRLGAGDVTVVGNSVGGWIAAELALLGSPRVGRIVLVGAVGIDVPGHPVTDVSKLTPTEIMGLSYHNPKPFLVDPATLTDDQRAVVGANRAALQVYAPRMTDPTLAGRLARVAAPVLVISGESDRIVGPEYGRAWATAIPGARFELLAGTGHVPQVETPELLLETIWDYVKAGR